jgi:hypothetical protein
MRFLFTLLFVSVFFKSFSNPKTHLLYADGDTVKRHIKKEVHFPDPVNISKLFYIQRDPNANTLIYELNTNQAANWILITRSTFIGSVMQIKGKRMN